MSGIHVVNNTIEIDVIPDNYFDLTIVTENDLAIEVNPSILIVEIHPISGLISSYEIKENLEILNVLQDGQINFTLSQSSTTPENAKLFLNGQKMSYGQDYNIVDNSLFWTSDQVLETTDELELYFY